MVGGCGYSNPQGQKRGEKRENGTPAQWPIAVAQNRALLPPAIVTLGLDPWTGELRHTRGLRGHTNQML
jgi:hypothetical protein